MKSTFFCEEAGTGIVVACFGVFWPNFWGDRRMDLNPAIVGIFEVVSCEVGAAVFSGVDFLPKRKGDDCVCFGVGEGGSGLSSCGASFDGEEMQVLYDSVE